MKSDFMKLNFKDILRGLIIAVGTSLIGMLGPILNSGKLPTIEEIKTIGIIGAGAGLVYLGKNLLTNSSDELLKTE